MTDLKTTFAGLSLRNPIIISSSGLTNSVGKNKKNWPKMVPVLSF